MGLPEVREKTRSDHLVALSSLRQPTKFPEVPGQGRQNYENVH